MGANTYIGKNQLGYNQLKVICAIYEGAILTSQLLLNKKKRYNPIYFKNSIKRLNEREIIRLIKKGCIKIKNVNTNKKAIIHQYELTNYSINLIENNGNISNKTR